MKKLLLLKGLPASGKSTFAKERVSSNPQQWKRVNKDELRQMLHGGKWTSKIEKDIEAAEEALAGRFLDAGFSVIVDDTNFHPKHHDRYLALANQKGAIFETKTFDVEVEEAIKRDLTRPNPVGETVIRRMHRQYVRKWQLKPDEVPNAPWVVLCDLDGTLANMNGRDPYDASTCERDLLNEPVADVIERYQHVMFLSGRKDTYRAETERWLKLHGFDQHPLYMRAGDDNRKDSIVKKEIYEAEVKGKFNVRFVLDDRDQVVELWRSLGLTCFQVAEGNF
jgi:predicted kinase